MRTAPTPGTIRYLESSLIRKLQQRAADRTNAVNLRFDATAMPAPLLSLAELHAIEAHLGFALPDSLREVYLHVGNGGFGPGYGLLGVGSGATDDLGNTADSLYLLFSQSDPDDPEWSWRRRVVPFSYWGCAVYSCITPDGRVVGFDEGTWVDDEIDLDEWLSRWLDGSLKQPTATTN